jgi:hypothetical protein
MTTGRWLVFQISALVLATTFLILNWQHGQPWSAQPYLVPLTVAISPLLFYPILKSQRRETLTPRRHIFNVIVLLSETMLLEFIPLARVCEDDRRLCG